MEGACNCDFRREKCPPPSTSPTTGLNSLPGTRETYSGLPVTRLTFIVVTCLTNPVSRLCFFHVFMRTQFHQPGSMDNRALEIAVKLALRAQVTGDGGDGVDWMRAGQRRITACWVGLGLIRRVFRAHSRFLPPNPLNPLLGIFLSAFLFGSISTGQRTLFLRLARFANASL